MTVTINGTTGVSLVQDSTITSEKIVDGTIAVTDLSTDSTSIGVGQTIATIPGVAKVVEAQAAVLRSQI
jgi:hypothetical protein